MSGVLSPDKQRIHSILESIEHLLEFVGNRKHTWTSRRVYNMRGWSSRVSIYAICIHYTAPWNRMCVCVISVCYWELRWYGTCRVRSQCVVTHRGPRGRRQAPFKHTIDLCVRKHHMAQRENRYGLLTRRGLSPSFNKWKEKCSLKLEDRIPLRKSSMIFDFLERVIFKHVPNRWSTRELLLSRLTTHSHSAVVQTARRK